MSKPVSACVETVLDLQAKGLIGHGERPMLSYIEGHYYWMVPLRPKIRATEEQVINSLIDHSIFLQDIINAYEDGYNQLERLSNEEE